MKGWISCMPRLIAVAQLLLFSPPSYVPIYTRDGTHKKISHVMHAWDNVYCLISCDKDTRYIDASVHCAGMSISINSVRQVRAWWWHKPLPLTSTVDFWHNTGYRYKQSPSQPYSTWKNTIAMAKTWLSTLNIIPSISQGYDYKGGLILSSHSLWYFQTWAQWNNLCNL